MIRNLVLSVLPLRRIIFSGSDNRCFSMGVGSFLRWVSGDSQKKFFGLTKGRTVTNLRVERRHIMRRGALHSWSGAALSFKNSHCDVTGADGIKLCYRSGISLWNRKKLVPVNTSQKLCRLLVNHPSPGQTICLESENSSVRDITCKRQLKVRRRRGGRGLFEFQFRI